MMPVRRRVGKRGGNRFSNSNLTVAMFLLDTHAFVWQASDLKRLSGAALKAVADYADALHLSAVTA